MKRKPTKSSSAQGTGSVEIDRYLAALSDDQRRLLEDLRRKIRAVIPDAEECISYRIPAFRLGGVVVAGFSARSSGCSFYPFSGTTLDTLADELTAFSRTKSALHFSSDTPLAAALVRRLLKTRVAEIPK